MNPITPLELLTLLQDIDIHDCNLHFQLGVTRRLNQLNTPLEQITLGQLRDCIQEYSAYYNRTHGGHA